ncbi:N-formylglutamate amidohydrolase [bacterium]|nr:N-formylglutamate amidohydrolase [bacterium]
MQILLTCEHGGHDVPPEYAPLFAGADDVLASHRGWDPGALELAKFLAERLEVTLLPVTVTRLLIEPNRSLHHRRLFSEFTRPLPKSERQVIIDRFYTPHLQRVTAAVESLLKKSHRVLHIGVHSFTPVFDGVPRNCDIGLLYDPQRILDRQFCHDWQQALRAATPQLRVRLNYPYRGISDGLTTSLRRRFAPEQYLGMELEFAHDWKVDRRDKWPEFCETLLQTLKSAYAKAGTRADV